MLAAAARRPILFCIHHPPPADPGLSFHGGLPLAPPGTEWPRGPSGVSLSFVMQWDCAELAAQDATGLLPTSGVLLLFLDLAWGERTACRFLHGDAPRAALRPMTPPADLPPLFGDEWRHL